MGVKIFGLIARVSDRLPLWRQSCLEIEASLGLRKKSYRALEALFSNSTSDKRFSTR